MEFKNTAKVGFLSALVFASGLKYDPLIPVPEEPKPAEASPIERESLRPVTLAPQPTKVASVLDRFGEDEEGIFVKDLEGCRLYFRPEPALVKGHFASGHWDEAVQCD